MNKEILKGFINNSLHKEVSSEELLKFSLYEKLLLEWNEKINLTAIVDEQGILEKHFIDSIYPMMFIDFSNKSLCDIGSGAGFPGMPLAILNPSLKVTLVESNGKKVTFLNAVKEALKLDNVTVIKSRAEDLDKRDTFDYVSARAVTQLNILSELAIPSLKVKGELLAYKLYDVEGEVDNAKKALKALGSSLKEIKKYHLPLSNDGRSLVVVRKDEPTKKKYPREYSEIVSKPL